MVGNGRAGFSDLPHLLAGGRGSVVRVGIDAGCHQITQLQTHISRAEKKEGK